MPNVHRLLLTLALFASALAAHGQVGVYLMGSAGHLSAQPVTVATGPGVSVVSQGSFWAYGGTLGVYNNFLRLGPLKLGGDLRGFSQTSSNNIALSGGNKIRGALFGLRLAGSAPLVPFKPYVQAEVGAASTNFGVNASRTGGFVYQVQAGADFTIFPHLDARAEYGVGQIVNFAGLGSSKGYTLQQLGAGAVIRF